MAERPEEREGHAAADQERVDALEQVLDQRELVGDLGPAQDRDERAAPGASRMRPSAVQLLLHQEAGRRRLQVLRDAAIEAWARCAAANASFT